MSYILDALKKADQERSIGDVPDLDTPHWTQRRSGPVRPWVWVLIGLLVVNGALLAVLFSRDNSRTARFAEVEDSVPLQPLARPERNITPRPRQAMPPVVQRPPPAAVTPRVTVARPPLARPAAPAAAPEPTPKPAPAPAPAPAPKPALAPVQAGAAEIPEWNELPLEFRSGFNPPRLDVHVYATEPSRRFILVELQRYVEGDTLGNGAKLEKILPGGIQLYYQGTRFRIDR